MPAEPRREGTVSEPDQRPPEPTSGSDTTGSEGGGGWTGPDRIPPETGKPEEPPRRPRP